LTFNLNIVISNIVVPRIKVITKQVNIKPTFIPVAVEDCSKGVHAKRYIFKTAWKMLSEIPIHRTSVFFNSLHASINVLFSLSFGLLFGLFSAHITCVDIIPNKDKIIEIHKGAKTP
jgi:hypothetical protein